MAKEVNVHLKTTGATRAKQQLDEVGKSSKQVGQKTAEGAKTGAAGMDKLKKSATSTQGRFGKFTKKLASWATGFVGITAIITGVTQAIRVQAEALKEHAEIAAAQQKKLLALQAMGTFFEEHPEARKEVAAYAKAGRRPFEEVAGAWYALESKGAGLTEQQKKGIMKEALELGRMEPEADLESIVGVFSLYAKETRQKDINQVQNVIRQTLSVAGAELSGMGKYLPRFLPAGIAGGLTGPEAAGLWAFATTRTGTPEEATVGIRNIFASLRGKGTPESKELLQKLGITPEMNIFKQLTALSASQRAGKFGVPEAEIIAGKENFALLLSMLTEPTAMMETVRQVTSVARPDIDIVRDKLGRIMGQDEVARLEELTRQLDVEIANIKGGDVKAMRWNVALKEYEKRMREAGIPEIWIKWQLAKYTLAAGFKGEEPSPSWWLEPFGEFTEFPTGQQRAGATETHYHNEQIFNPVAGESRKGPRVAPGVVR